METTNNDQLKQTLEAVKSITPKHCDNCGHKYGEQNFKLVKNDFSHKVIHIHCDSCGNSYLLNIVQPANGMFGSTRSQVNLDLSNVKEMMKFASENAISQNDALDAYNTFTSQPGILDGLFKGQPAGNFTAQKRPVNSQLKQ